jgi:hypothetical protein
MSRKRAAPTRLANGAGLNHGHHSREAPIRADAHATPSKPVTVLAYVFWHQPAAGTDAAEYDRRLSAFHQALAQEQPLGFTQSAAFRTRELPWAPPAVASYEDWYLVEDSAALDVLNDAAVTSGRKEPHDRAAALAAWGAAGLYRLRLGRVMLESAKVACWLSKPPGTTYPEFYRDLELALGRTAFSLWGRQMVLGPTPEFCVHLTAERTLPYPIAHTVALEPVVVAAGA